MRQSIKRIAKSSKRLAVRPDMDCQEKMSDLILSTFSEAYLPIDKAVASLVNLPTKKAGIIYKGLTRAMPPATNNGVVGKGNNE